jgi:hypothetical protein
VTELTEDEILTRAKQLANDDGKLWDNSDIKNGSKLRDRVADDSLRAEYLTRAREMLKGQWT